jgi:hypothetical protein
MLLSCSHLGGNNLTGSLPEEWSTFSKMLFLWVAKLRAWLAHYHCMPSLYSNQAQISS